MAAIKKPKDDPTVQYQKRSLNVNTPVGSVPYMKHCKGCASRIKPVRCTLVAGRIWRRGSCNLWTLSSPFP